MTTRPAWQLGDTPTRKRPGRVDQIRTATVAPTLRAATSGIVPDSIGELHGYGAVFDQWATIADRSGEYLERVARGAFRQATSNPNSVKILFGHGRDSMMGERPLGPVTMLREDEYGLAYTCELLPTWSARELLPGLQAGLYGSSYRFSIDREDYNTRAGRSAHNPQGLPERTILEASVFECGPCTWPAFDGATAGATKSGATTIALSSNTAGALAASKTPRRTTRPSWELPRPSTATRSPYL